MKKILLVLLLISVSIQLTYGQKGTLRGKVLDRESGETLPGATVAVKGKPIGTTTDFDGNYELKIEPGTYTIEISYVSYAAQVFKDIEIKEDEVEVLNTNLAQQQTEIGSVVVTSRSRQRTENAMQLLQKKSGRLMDGISYEKIAKLGDSNAAGALKRVTGVSVQDDKYVFVRGLSDRYTMITLNDAVIPAMDPEKNTVQMDIFPSNIIENIVVNKNFTPDMQGESTGGQVDIETKDFPEKFNLEFSSKFGYNPQANLNEDFLSYPGSETDALGFDNGTRDIPGDAADALNTMVEENRGELNEFTFEDDITKITESFNPIMSPERKNSFLDHSHKFSIGNQVKLFGKSLGYNASLSYARDFSFYDNGTNSLYEEHITPSPLKILNDQQGKEKVLIAGLINLNLKLDKNHKIGTRYLRNQSGNKTARYQDGYFYYESSDNTVRNLSWIERAFNYYQLHGKHIFPDLNKTTVEWQASITEMQQEEPDLRFFENLYETDSNDDPYGWRIKTNDVPVRFYRDMYETDINTKLDIEIPISFLGQKSKIKTGGLYTSKDRDMDNIQFKLNSYLTSFPEGDVNSYLENNIYSEENPNGYKYKSDHTDNLTNSYRAKQSVIAAYAMIDANITSALRLVTGARIEQSETFSENKVDKSHRNYRKGEINKTDILPSFNFTYKIMEDMNIRLGMSRTLARPKFQEIGTNYYDYTRGAYIYANPDLEQTTINNLDLRWEYFIDKGEKIAISGFYKKFDNPIELRLKTGTQNYEIEPFNSEPADLYGVELEVVKELDFIPGMQNFTAGGNFTAIESVITVPEDIMEYIRAKDPERDDKRPMLGQAPFIINAFLGYKNDKYDVDANLGFNINGEKLYLITKGRLPYAYEEPRAMLNFNVSKTLNDNFGIELAVNNILDAEYKATHHFKDSDRYMHNYKEGRTYSLSLKYKLR
ncbi:MAG: TonB-dependent receptor domain-containing protein [Bacteroidales bacterium]